MAFGNHETQPQRRSESYLFNPENFSRGITSVEIPELGKKIRGKVRDNWDLGDGRRVIITTDRLSALDHVICSVPGKGQVLNMLSNYWMEQVSEILPNHIIETPHPNVVIAKQALATLPVELVIRQYMAETSTNTSIFSQYQKGKRNIYGMNFPDGLEANQEFPEGSIVTPTTKAGQGKHDKPLTNEEASALVDKHLGKRFGYGLWEEARERALGVFELGRAMTTESGLLLVDTKYEIGIGPDGKLMLIDEVHTPDSSRFWEAETYTSRLAIGLNPVAFDKELVRKYLAKKKYKGKGTVPKIPDELIDEVSLAYETCYELLTRTALGVPETDPLAIKEAVLDAVFKAA